MHIVDPGHEGKPKTPEKPPADKMRPAIEPLCLNVRDASKALGISEPTLRNLAYTDGFPAFRIGDRWMFPVDGLRRWLLAQIPEPVRMASK